MMTSAKIMGDLRKYFRKIAQNSGTYGEKVGDFTRKRKLYFSKLVKLMLSLLKKVCRQNLTSFLRGVRLVPNRLLPSPKEPQNKFFRKPIC